MAKKRGSEIRAGIVVLLGLVVLGGALFIVSGGADRFRDKNLIPVLFLDSGGIAPGASVFLAGRRVGTVSNVEDREAKSPKGVLRTYVAVVVETNTDVKIPIDSRLTVSRSITNTVTMEIARGISKEFATEESVLYGSRLATFEEAIHNASELLNDARGAVKRVDGILLKVEGVVEEIDVKTMQGKANDFLDSLNRSGKKVETILADVKGPLDDTMQKALSGAGDLQALLAKVRADWEVLRPKVDASLDNMANATGRLDTIVKENRAGIRSIVQKIDDGVTRLSPAMQKLEETIFEMKGTVVEIRPQLRTGIASARRALQNFEGLTGDLKTAPWKLINKPTESDANEIKLYNAARLYVETAGRLEELTDDLETLKRLGLTEDEGTARTVDSILVKLEENLKEFQKRQKNLVDLMTKR